VSVSAADNLRLLADPKYGLARGFDDAQQTITTAADMLDAIDALHQPERHEGTTYCKHDGFVWPCLDHRILHPEEGLNGS
jgi:hypothetical protein